MARTALSCVARGVDEHTGAPIALKGLTGGPSESLLWAELRQLRRVSHPTIPKVIDLCRSEEAWGALPARTLVLVTEWVDGATVEELAGALHGPALVEALIAILRDVGAALAHLHAAGLVHRDVAPRNIKWDGGAGRAFLLDLGLARDISERSDDAAGTLAYLAPEALVGQPEPRSDLYGLGASVISLVTGEGLFPESREDPGALARAIVRGAAAPALPALPTALAALLRGLVATEASARPASAAAMLDQLDHAVRALPGGARARVEHLPDAPPPRPPLTGRRELVQSLASRLTRAGLSVLIGGAARGGWEIAEAATSQLALSRLGRGEAVPLRAAGTLDDVARRLGVSAHAVIERAHAPAANDAPPAVVILDAIGDERASAVVRALWRPGLTAAAVVLIDEACARTLALDASDEPAATSLPWSVSLPPLPAAALAELWHAHRGRRPTDEELAALQEQSGGEPAIAVALAAAAAPITPRDVEGWKLLWQRAPASCQRLACAAALWPEGVPLDLLLAVVEEDGLGLADITRAERAGLVGRTSANALPIVTLRQPIGALARSWLGPGAWRELARRAAALAERLAAPPQLRAAPLLQLEGRELAAVSALALVRELARADAPGAAEQLAAHLDEQLAEPGNERLRELISLRAELAFSRGDYEAAIAHAERAGDPPAALLAARAKARCGRRAEAMASLAALASAGSAVAGKAALALARACIADGQLERAEALATSVDETERERAEILGLVAFYRGDLDVADRQFAEAERAATIVDARVELGRALSLRGMVAQQRGLLAAASERYAHAAALLAAAFEPHAAATADLNLGTTLTERGRFAEALAYTAAAGQIFAGLRADADWVAAEVNRANCLLGVGDPTSARVALEAARAHPAASPHLRAFAELTLAEVSRRGGDLVDAAARCRRVIDEHQSDAHARIAAHLGLAECGTGLAHDELDALATSDDDRQRVALAVARRALIRRAPAAELLAASATAGAVAQRALASDRQERAFRAFAVAAQLAGAASDASAATLAQRAIATHATLVAAAPAVLGAAMLADPDRRAVDGLVTPSASERAAPAPRRSDDDAAARRLLALSLRIHREAELTRILDEVIDTAIELAAAERGFLLLRNGEGRLEAVVARNFTPNATTGGDDVSRSIAERAAQLGEPVVTIDAGLDSRFDTASSVAALRLRSVLAVPMRQRGDAIGCIYVDHRLRRGAFDERAAALLSELGDIAAIAIGNAQLTAELRQRGAEIEHLNRALAAELADRDAELARVRSSSPSRALRGSYQAIAGSSEAITRMLELVDRAATTSFPVVVVGESGTGKELVARALHEASPRRAGPFVAVNCSALPDTLLESELFGHVRGAFTGADRDRRGMFEIAHGGTLFLDEIADTSTAMQSRLLRVLQDGVVRRLGDSAVTKVDVRVIAAGQRPLDELVAAGRFREDLRYRLEVLSIPVPPLRERAGDLPVLIDHLLRRLCAELSPPRALPRLSRAASRALASYAWPGNVRELANVLAHGLAMAGEDHDVIELGDLPAPIAAGSARGRDAPAAAPADDDLRLRPALRAVERAYVQAAMERTGRNQTAAAKLLGLSRFGLQKKLRRLERNDDADDEQDDASE